MTCAASLRRCRPTASTGGDLAVGIVEDAAAVASTAIANTKAGAVSARLAVATVEVVVCTAPEAATLTNASSSCCSYLDAVLCLLTGYSPSLLRSPRRLSSRLRRRRQRKSIRATSHHRSSRVARGLQWSFVALQNALKKPSSLNSVLEPSEPQVVWV